MARRGRAVAGNLAASDGALGPTAGAGVPGTPARLRADARRNREQLITAAREVFVEQGVAAPLEEVARRAGVGIATLYRRFPDRRALQEAVALDILGRVRDEGALALAEEPEPFAALARYMHRVLDLRVGAIMPQLIGALDALPDELAAVRDAAAVPTQALLDAALASGALRPDVTFADIGLLIARLSQPLPGPFPRAMLDALAHRHLELLLGGLRATPAHPAPPLPGPALTLAALQALAPGNRADLAPEPDDGTA